MCTCTTYCTGVLQYTVRLYVLVTWNSHSGNSRGRESLEFPLEFPPRKRPFLGNSREFPYRGGSFAYRGGSFAYGGGDLVASLPRYHQVSYTPRLGSPFATVVVSATAIRASPAFEERRNKETAHEASLKSRIDEI